MRCGYDGCRFAFNHVGKCATTEIGRRCGEAERAMAQELAHAMVFGFHHRPTRLTGIAEMVSSDNAILQSLRRPL